MSASEKPSERYILSDNERIQHRCRTCYRPDRRRTSNIMLVNGKLVTGARLSRNQLKGFLSVSIERHGVGSGLLAEFVESKRDHFLAILKMPPPFGNFRAASPCRFIKLFLPFGAVLDFPSLGAGSHDLGQCHTIGCISKRAIGPASGSEIP